MLCQIDLKSQRYLNIKHQVCICFITTYRRRNKTENATVNFSGDFFESHMFEKIVCHIVGNRCRQFGPLGLYSSLCWGVKHKMRKSKTQFRAQNGCSNSIDFNPAAFSALAPLCFGNIKHLGCSIRLPHRVPGKTNLEWFHF